MGTVTGIAWTHHTFNGWIGCARVSDGCLNCYAEARNDRYGEGLWGKNAPRRVTSDSNWQLPLRWNREAEAAGRPALVFCSSLADVFEDRPDLIEPRARLFALIESTPWLRWQLLTKRPENVARLVPPAWLGHESPGMVRVDDHHLVPVAYLTPYERAGVVIAWPSNAWIGATVEHQAAAESRVPVLASIPSPVRFLSCEPLLGPIDLPVVPGHETIDWVIVGGESGPGYRQMDPAWARSLVWQCEEELHVPVFFKQMGGTKRIGGHWGGDLLDGRRIQQFPAVYDPATPVTIGPEM